MSRHFLSIKILIILFFPVVLSSPILAKNVTISGRVSNPEGNPLKKVKGGGTKKVCLPAAKVRSMSKDERDKVVRAKRKAAKGGTYKRSSKSFVKGARKKGATLRDWFQKENWVQVGNPSKKCGEK